MSLALDPKPAPSSHDRFDVTAEGLGRYTIEVSLPPKRREGERYPVILVVDGNLLFDVARVAVHGGFAAAGGVLPPSIVVGVGYPADEGFASFYARRNYDFHGPWDMSDWIGQFLGRIFDAIRKQEGRSDLEIRAGGYDRFLGFLRDELLPALATRYPIDQGGRHTLIGDSSGGHFVLKALYDPTSPFRRYICISPGFASGAGEIERAEAAYAANHQDLDVDLFICCGRVEIDESVHNAMIRFGSGVVWVAEQFAIRRWPSARIDWEIMNNEDHGSIQLRSIGAGLRSVHRLRPGLHVEEIRKAQAAAMEAMGIGQ